MPSLPELQRDFARGLLDDSAATPSAIAGGTLSAGARLGIYRNNHRGSLRRALADCFPVLLRLVGDGFFDFLAAAYLREHPSRSGNLHDLGGHMPAFVAGFPAASGHAYLADVAALEWAWQEAYHASFHAPLDVARLGEVPEAEHETLRLRLHPSCRLLRSQYPLLSIWLANQADIEEEAVPEVNLDSGAQTLLVHRPGLEVLVRSTTHGEYALLHALSRYESLGEACEAALQTDGGFDLGDCMRSLVSSGVIVDFER